MSCSVPRPPVRTIGVVLAAIVAVGATPARGLSAGDIRWLDRVTFGVNASTVARYRLIGRARFLDEQLHPPASDPDGLTAEIHALQITTESAADRIKANQAEQTRINALPTDDEKQLARTAFNQTSNTVVYETMKRHLARALESPWQLREQMTWFWMNHFSVFQGKANVRWTLAEYEEDTIRAHALGKFSDLVMATATSPAMLEYLDNAQSAAGKINENYAREMMELHTLGVSGGPSGSRYTQTDVQELARVLTGAGVNFSGKEPNLPPARRELYVHRGLFEFNPARHDMGDATVLGHAFHGGDGLGEIEHAVRLLCAQPATAKFISRNLATYFIADEPPQPIVDRMAATFEQTDGSIAAVLGEMLADKDVLAALNAPAPKLEKFKDPMVFVVSSLRMAYDGKSITNYHSIDRLAPAARRAALRSRDSGRLPTHGIRLDEFRSDDSPLRNRARHRERQRRTVQRGRQQARPDDGVSPSDVEAVLRRDRAGPRPEDARRAEPHGVAAGVEHRPAGIARLDAEMTFSRRDMLKLGLVAAAHPLFLPMRGIVSQAFAAPGAADAKFLLVFLRGGYDAASVVVPVSSSFYYESRPTIAIPLPDPANPLSAVSLSRPGEGATWGLHPALRNSMLPLWRKGQLAFVPFAGTDDLTRSHFETQDSVEGGMPVAPADGGARTYGSGFLNRLAAALDGAGAPVAFTDGLPVAMTGDVVVPNVSLKGTGKPPFDDRQMKLFLDMYGGTRFEPLITEGFDLRKTVAEQAQMMASGTINNEMQAANRNAITATGFELEARRMAGLMQDKFNIGFIDVGGWDTHVNQGNAQGQLANLLTSLGQGLAGFADQMGAGLESHGRRRDLGVRAHVPRKRHARHGPRPRQRVLGARRRDSGRSHGRRRQCRCRAETLNQNRDFPVLTEYRAHARRPLQASLFARCQPDGSCVSESHAARSQSRLVAENAAPTL